MKLRIIEESVLFVSILKWIVLAAGIGFVVGVSTTAFLKILAAAIAFAQDFPHYYLALPLGLFASVLIVKYIAREAQGYGTEKVIEAVHKNGGAMRAVVIPAKLCATVVTIAAGGSAGQVGPCAQIGGGLAAAFANAFRLDANDRKKLVICGISAGFAAVLGAPVAGAVFGLEVLFVGSLLYEVLLPSFIAGIISYHTAAVLGIDYFHYPVHLQPVFTEVFFLEIIGAGIFFGLCAILAIESLRLTRSLFDKIPVWPPLKGIIGGIFLIVLAFLTSFRYLGLGMEIIADSLQGVKVAASAFVMKILFTAVTFASGGSGGIIAPLMVIGAAAGAFFAAMTGLDAATFAAVGLVSVLAGAANTPIAMSILAIELFGKGIGAYAAIACVISFLITGHRSIFPTQVMAMKKSSSVEVELGQELDKVQARYKFREKSVIGTGIKMTKRIRKPGNGQKD